MEEKERKHEFKTRDMEGWLEKRGADVFPIWKSRFFTIKGHELAYFKEENKGKPEKLTTPLEWRGSIRLDHAKRVTRNPSNLNYFNIELPNRTYCLWSKKSNISQKWFDSLDERVAFYREERISGLRKEVKLDFELELLPKIKVAQQDEERNGSLSPSSPSPSGSFGSFGDEKDAKDSSSSSSSTSSVLIPTLSGLNLSSSGSPSPSPSSPSPGHILSPKQRSMTELLDSLEFGEEMNRKFIDEGFDIDSLMLLGQEEMKELGLPMGVRLKILHEIKQLRDKDKDKENLAEDQTQQDHLRPSSASSTSASTSPSTDKFKCPYGHIHHDDGDEYYSEKDLSTDERYQEDVDLLNIRYSNDDSQVQDGKKPARRRSGHLRSSAETLKGLRSAVFIKDVKKERQIGKGQFGVVWEGIWQNTTKVALKQLWRKADEEEMKKDFEGFLREMKILQSMQHPNLVRFLGVFVNSPENEDQDDGESEDDFPEMYMVTEYVDGGSLDDFLVAHRASGSALCSSKTKLTVALGIAAGMNFIHSSKVLHRDLAARNILIDKGLVVKIADFGLSRPVGEDEAYQMERKKDTDILLPFKWTAPESIETFKYTYSSDIWSFGIVLYEIASDGGLPYPDMTNSEAVKAIKGGYRMPPPPDCPPVFAQVMESCWHASPLLRPSFKQIHEILQREMTSEEFSSQSPIYQDILPPVVAIYNDEDRILETDTAKMYDS